MGELKKILYFGPSRAQFKSLLNVLAKADGCQRLDAPGSEIGQFMQGGSPMVWMASDDPEGMLDALDHHYVNLIVLDLRAPRLEDPKAHFKRTIDLLDALDSVEDPEDRYGFHRILALLPAHRFLELEHVVLCLGARGVRQVLCETTESSATNGSGAGSPLFANQLLEKAGDVIRARRTGKRALCAAGGGTTGIYFEIGALKCIEDCLTRADLDGQVSGNSGRNSGGVINSFDMFFGVSAGAVVTSMLAVGYSIEELMAAVIGADVGRLPPLSLNLFRLCHIDYLAIRRRFLEGTFKTATALVRAARTRSVVSPLQALLFDLASLVGAPFRGDRFEATLRAMLSAPNGTDDFRLLGRRLFIAATDQDARHPVLFGDEANDDVPISKAVRASMSINPAFTATPIRGRYYEDGAVTRTSSFVEAIHRNASLILVLDPFLPHVSRVAGYANRRGILFNLDQDLRTVSYTRYENTRNWILRRHPDVSAYTFLPSNRSRHLLSVNPFDHRQYLEIWRGAYISTLKRIHRVHHRLAGDLAAHGLTLDISKAEEVANQLARTRRPTFSDFFPDGRIHVPEPRLCLSAQARRPAPTETAAAPAWTDGIEAASQAPEVGPTAEQ